MGWPNAPEDSALEYLPTSIRYPFQKERAGRPGRLSREWKQGWVMRLLKSAAGLIFPVVFVISTVQLVGPEFAGSVAWAAKRNRSAPEFELPTLDGSKQTLKAFRGKVVFLNFWATWCPPCVHEMPSMERLYGKLKGPDFILLAVSIDSLGKRVAAPFVKKMNITFPVLLDQDMEAMRAFGVRGMPTTFLLDREGEIVHQAVGPRDWDREETVQMIRKIMDQGNSK